MFLFYISFFEVFYCSLVLLRFFLCFSDDDISFHSYPACPSLFSVFVSLSDSPLMLPCCSGPSVSCLCVLCPVLFCHVSMSKSLSQSLLLSVLS